MKYEKDKITAIIPVYNVENYLERCLKSILYNTYTNLEIICVNDGSTDNSKKILEDYSKRDKRVVVINKKNAGVSSARNAGIKIATGEYIAFVDSDDWIHEKYFEYLIRGIDTADLVICNYIRSYRSGSVETDDAYGICMGHQQYLSREMKIILKEYQYLLHYAMDKKTKVIRLFHRIFGYWFTCNMIRFYLFCRRI